MKIIKTRRWHNFRAKYTCTNSMSQGDTSDTHHNDSTLSLRDQLSRSSLPNLSANSGRATSCLRGSTGFQLAPHAAPLPQRTSNVLTEQEARMLCQLAGHRQRSIARVGATKGSYRLAKRRASLLHSLRLASASLICMIVPWSVWLQAEP